MIEERRTVLCLCAVPMTIKFVTGYIQGASKNWTRCGATSEQDPLMQLWRHQEIDTLLEYCSNLRWFEERTTTSISVVQNQRCKRLARLVRDIVLFQSGKKINCIVNLYKSHNNKNDHLTRPREGPGLNAWVSRYHYPWSSNKQYCYGKSQVRITRVFLFADLRKVLNSLPDYNE